MSSSKFYIIFNIFNILLTVFILVAMNTSIDLVSDMRDAAIANIKLLCGLALYITYVTLKLRLPKILVNIAKKHNNSIINDFIQFIKNTPLNKKKILTLAF